MVLLEFLFCKECSSSWPSCCKAITLCHWQCEYPEAFLASLNWTEETNLNLKNIISLTSSTRNSVIDTMNKLWNAIVRVLHYKAAQLVSWWVIYVLSSKTEHDPCHRINFACSELEVRDWTDHTDPDWVLAEAGSAQLIYVEWKYKVK